jgi:hypothetical protein
VDTENKVSAVQLSARLRGVSPPVTRRLLITEQASLAQLHATLQVAFGWSDEHLYSFQIRGWQFGDPARAIELALAGGVDLPLAAFIFEINETFRYQYNLFVPWEIDCRMESRGLIPMTQPLACIAARGDPPDEEHRISTAHVESVMNHLVNHRLSKKQQMRWSPEGVSPSCSRSSSIRSRTAR